MGKKMQCMICHGGKWWVVHLFGPQVLGVIPWHQYPPLLVKHPKTLASTKNFTCMNTLNTCWPTLVTWVGRCS
jgi:hypothetical protein